VPGAGFGFTNAAKLVVDPVSSSQPQSRSPSPSSPVEKDYSAWFAPIPESILLPTANLFAPASALPLSPPQAASLFGLASALPTADDTTTDDDVERVPEHAQSVPMIGFMKASHKAYLKPSAEALELAKEKIRVWQEGDPEPEPAGTPAPKSPRRTIPGSIEESDSVESPGRMPDTPTPAGPSASSALGLGRLPGLTTSRGIGFSTVSQNFTGTAAGMNGGAKHNIRPKPFKPPLLKNKAPHPTSNAAGFTGSPLNPNRPHLFGTGTGFTPASAPHPLAAPPLTPGATTTTTPVRSTPSLPIGPAGFITPMRPLLGVTSRVDVNTNASAVRCTPAKFVTPFKAGMRPGEKGRVALESAKKGKDNEGQVLSGSTSVSTLQRTANSGRGKGKERWSAFDLGEFPMRFTRISARSRLISW
jgi:breast cancer 2 susceptibility protein